MFETPRASRLPVLRQCLRANETEPDEPRISDGGEAAAFGTAVHAALAEWSVNREFDAAPFARMVPDADRGEFYRALSNGQRMTTELTEGRKCEHVRVERGITLKGAAGEPLLTGTADRIWTEDQGGAVAVLDYKTGWKDHDYEWQGRGYALLGQNLFPNARQFRVHFLWTRFNSAETYTFNDDDLRETLAFVRHITAKGEAGTLGDFNPGEHCNRCPRRRSCPGRMRLARSVMEGTLDLRPETFDRLPAEQQAVVLQRAHGLVRQAEKVAGDMKAWVKERLRDAGGSMPLPGGREIALVQTETRQLIPSKALPVLGVDNPVRGMFATDAEFDAAVSLSVTAVERVVKARASRGAKGQAVEAIMEDMRARGALETRVRETIEAVDPLKKALAEGKENSDG